MPKRRGNQEGSLTLRKDGLWAERVSHEGKRIAAYGKSKEEARLKLRALLRKQEDNRPLTSSKMLMKDYMIQRLENLRYQVRPKTLVDYEGVVRLYLNPYLENIQLGKLEPAHI